MILFDLPVYQFIMSIFGLTSTMMLIMKFITTLGSTLVIVTSILCIAILVKNKKYRCGHPIAVLNEPIYFKGR